MIIESLELLNFRNYERECFIFDENTNVLYGDNAQGKTNVLEAIYFCSTSRSHRGSKDKKMIRFDMPEAHLRMNLLKGSIHHKVDIHLKRNKAKGIAVDGVPIKKTADLLGICNVVFFSPEDLNIIKEGPAGRRRFIDLELSQLDKIYLSNLHIAHDCNLACQYCFAEEGEYHGRRALMSYEVGKKALDFLVANSGSRRNLEVDFFGGEPLMNWKVVKELVAYGRELEKQYDKHFRFTLTTNGVLLNEEVQEFVNREMDNVVLSLDGRKEVNDRMRPFRNGKGSYDLIVPKFQKLAESRNQQKYYIRGTFTRNNLDFSKDVEHFADLGFEQVSIEPVVGEDTDPYAIQKEDLPQIFEEYDRLAKMIIDREKSGRGFNFFHFMIDLEGGPCVSKRLSGCGSGTEYLAVTPWGDLYPCHQFVGQEEFLMGNVDEGIVKPEIAEEFRGCSVYSKESCKTCFARFYCSGGCMANSYKFHHTINDTYEVSCEMERKRVECAIMIKAALADK